jgi:hypothetical protein
MFYGAGNAKQMDSSRAITCISTSNMIAFFMYIQDVQLIREAIKIIISSALYEQTVKLSHDWQ